ILDRYDYIIRDCPPSVGLLTLNALTATLSVIIPVQCEYYAMEGLAALKKTVYLVKQRLNPGIEIKGIVLTMFDARNNLAHQVAQELRNHFNEAVFNVVIPRNVRLSEAPSHGKPIILYDVKSKGALAYFQLAKEVLAQDFEVQPLKEEIYATTEKGPGEGPGITD
ncbi:MAG: ParA family protein, partial [Deltaproteobacteria bacterium]|nr:ParA family protein [Deltaproteobacteria bacterium]